MVCMCKEMLIKLCVGLYNAEIPKFNISCYELFLSAFIVLRDLKALLTSHVRIPEKLCYGSV